MENKLKAKLLTTHMPSSSKPRSPRASGVVLPPVLQGVTITPLPPPPPAKEPLITKIYRWMGFRAGRNGSSGSGRGGAKLKLSLKELRHIKGTPMKKSAPGAGDSSDVKDRGVNRQQKTTSKTWTAFAVAMSYVGLSQFEGSGSTDFGTSTIVSTAPSSSSSSPCSSSPMGAGERLMAETAFFPAFPEPANSPCSSQKGKGGLGIQTGIDENNENRRNSSESSESGGGKSSRCSSSSSKANISGRPAKPPKPLSPKPVKPPRLGLGLRFNSPRQHQSQGQNRGTEKELRVFMS